MSPPIFIIQESYRECVPGTDGPHSYRDFIDHPDCYLSDLEILETLLSRDAATPHLLAEERYRENVLRLQLRDLCHIGAVERIGHETYSLSEYGRQIATGEVTVPENAGILRIDEFDSYPRTEETQTLDDFSAIDGATMKETNQDIRRDTSSVYGWVNGDRELTKRRIRNVPDTDVHRLIREFPTHDPLPAACAHWVRAIVGLHLFPDANHRTATNTLEFILFENNGPSERVVQPGISRTVLHSKIVRALHCDVRFNTLWEKDELFYVWHRYFSQALTGDLEVRRPHDPPTEKLDQILEVAREKLQEKP